MPLSKRWLEGPPVRTTRKGRRKPAFSFNEFKIETGYCPATVEPTTSTAKSTALGGTRGIATTKPIA